MNLFKKIFWLTKNNKKTFLLLGVFLFAVVLFFSVSVKVDINNNSGVTHLGLYLEDSWAQFAVCDIPCVWPEVCVSDDAGGWVCRRTDGCADCEPSATCPNGCPTSKRCVGRICEERCNANACMAWDDGTNACVDTCNGNPCTPCVMGACTPIQCPVGQECSGGVCVQIVGCDDKHPCPDPQVCIAGECAAPACNNDGDCMPDEKCVNGGCQKWGDVFGCAQGGCVKVNVGDPGNSTCDGANPDLCTNGCQPSNYCCTEADCPGNSHCSGTDWYDCGFGVCNDNHVCGYGDACDKTDCSAQVDNGYICTMIAKGYGGTGWARDLWTGVCDNGCSLVQTEDTGANPCPRCILNCNIETCIGGKQCTISTPTEGACDFDIGAPACVIPYPQTTCSEDPCTPKTCTSDSECGSGEVCVNGTCQTGGGGSCGTDKTCSVGGGGASCSNNSQCGGGGGGGKCDTNNTCSADGTGADCSGDTDCTGGSTCNSSGQCVAGGGGSSCTDSSSCPQPSQCGANNTCTPGGGGKACTADSECSSGGNTCNSSKQCVSGGGGADCTSDTDCGGGGAGKCSSSASSPYVCDPSNDGVSCTSNSGCAPICTPNQTCAPGGDGSGSGASCDLTTDCSLRCNSQSQCVPGGDGNATGASCAVDTDCAPPAKGCNSDKQCVVGGSGAECTDDAGCDLPTKCASDYTCVPGGTGADCSTASDCQVTSSKCGQDETCSIAGTGKFCTSDSQCTSIFSTCDSYGSCFLGGGGSVCTSSGDCTSAASCAGDGSCVVGGGGATCSSSTDCEPLISKCNTQGQCVPGGTGVECFGDTDCALKCNAQKQCVAGGPGQSCTVANQAVDCANIYKCDNTTKQCKTSGTGGVCDPAKNGADCSITHLECINATCQQVSGTGENACTIENAECCSLNDPSRICNECGHQFCGSNGHWNLCSDTYYATNTDGRCVCYEGGLNDECVVPTDPPTVESMQILTDANCASDGAPAGGAVARFRWRFSHVTPIAGTEILFQLSTKRSFENPEYTQRFTNSTFSKTATVYIYPREDKVDCNADLENCAINYNEQYYWRVKIIKNGTEVESYYFDGNGVSTSSSNAVAYEKTGHPWPFVAYSKTPERVLKDDIVTFDSTDSKCYDGNGLEFPCGDIQGQLNYSWLIDANAKSDKVTTTYSFSEKGAKETSLTICEGPIMCCTEELPFSVYINQNLPEYKEVSPFQ